MNIEDFDYHLPEHLIAQTPAQEREDARLLCLTSAGVTHNKFPFIRQLLKPGDVLVLNDTRVLKARLRGHKATGGAVEVLLERPLDEHLGLCQVRASKPLRPDAILNIGAEEVVVRGRDGQFYELAFPRPLFEFLEQHGSVPLPPYIEHQPDGMDSERYQTVFGTRPGAVAAPTAGLHFSQPLLDELAGQGIDIQFVTLHVGAGTFQPVRGAIEDHVMHKEWYALNAAVAERINCARAAGQRVVAVGTTAVRTLETVAARHGGNLQADQGETQLFIKPGFEFAVVDALITNFHLPKSTLMMLISAFAGRERVLSAYAEAVREQYRFFSYGDACWLEKHV
ncbi:MAG: tRNA preQ1(34) S-adenosylmethionine ribosyltransferase-isomerase QueA [Pseudomonadales bacterium]